MKIKSAVIMSAFLFSCGCGNFSSLSQPTETWDTRNDPILMGDNYQRVLSELPTSGSLDSTPWSDTYWPNYRGGIAKRWLDSTSDSYTYVTNMFEQLQTMEQNQIKLLSPAEKYDIFVGNYYYPTLAGERSRTNINDEHWSGLCHGWSPAAINFTEPMPIVLTNAAGIQIPFGSSDIKALLIYYYGVVANTPSKILGGRCNENTITSQSAVTPECRDVNAGSFHIVLTNEIGLLKRGFVADIEIGPQVWNQPVYAYSSKILAEHAPSPGAATGTVKEIDLETTMHYVNEMSASWNAHGANQATDSKIYKYKLELDASNKIIGGEWLSSARPDFLWHSPKPTFFGYYSQIKTIYDASVQIVAPTPMPMPIP